jgi:hypothetical protein
LLQQRRHLTVAQLDEQKNGDEIQSFTS